MRTSDNGVAMIKGFEGFRAEAYKCPAGVWTIGYGHTYGVKQGDTCTEQQAEQWLRKDLEWAESSARKHVPGATQTQFDALVSFVFNLGAVAFAGSSLYRLIKADAAPENIRRSWMMWNKAKVNGKLQPLPGLTARREREVEVYINGNYGD